MMHYNMDIDSIYCIITILNYSSYCFELIKDIGKALILQSTLLQQSPKSDQT